MKLLLINPPFLPKYSRASRSPAVTKSGTIYYPLWLAHAAGLLEAKGHEVKLIDFPAGGINLEGRKKEITGFNPDIMVFETSTPSVESDVKCVERIKSWFQDKKIAVLVGTHPTAMPHETLNLSGSVDIIVRGEYDWALCDLAAGKGDFTGVSGISYRLNSVIVDNPARTPGENLDEVPFVSKVYKKHLNINDYFYAHCKNPVISIFAGRGCPNRCTYCVYPQVMFGRRYRHRSAGNFVDELEYIKKEFPRVKEVLIDDDNFAADRKFVEDVCEEIIRRGIKLVWTVEVRADLQLKLMKKMKQAGCRMLVAGFESGNQKILDNINKGITVEQSLEFVKNAKKAGLRVHGCFMAGNPGETKQTLQETLDFAIKLEPDTAQFFPLMVYPGTEAFRWAQSKDFIRAKCFRDWLTPEGLHNCVLETPDLKPAELVNFCNYARKKFYLRPKYIFYKLADIIAHPGEAVRTLKSLKTFFKYLIKTE